MATVPATAGIAGQIETLMFGLSQLFLVPVLIVIALLFLYAFFALGAFAWQWRQRRRQVPEAFELIEARRRTPNLSLAELESEAAARLETVRVVTRVSPMLGLVATMIPLGPALKALGDGQLMDVSRSLMVAFSAVILSLLASALTYWISNVRRRWYSIELLQIERETAARP